MVGDCVLEEQIEVDRDASAAGRDIQMNRVNVVRVARPHQSRLPGMDLNGGYLLKRPSWSMFSRTPFRIRERQRTWLHLEILVHKRNAARGLRFIDDQRHRGSALRAHSRCKKRQSDE